MAPQLGLPAGASSFCFPAWPPILQFGHSFLEFFFGFCGHPLDSLWISRAFWRSLENLIDALGFALILCGMLVLGGMWHLCGNSGEFWGNVGKTWGFLGEFWPQAPEKIWSSLDFSRFGERFQHTSQLFWPPFWCLVLGCGVSSWPGWVKEISPKCATSMQQVYAKHV